MQIAKKNLVSFVLPIVRLAIAVGKAAGTRDGCNLLKHELSGSSLVDILFCMTVGSALGCLIDELRHLTPFIDEAPLVCILGMYQPLTARYFSMNGTGGSAL
jgi:hypothetical protein